MERAGAIRDVGVGERPNSAVPEGVEGNEGVCTIRQTLNNDYYYLNNRYYCKMSTDPRIIFIIPYRDREQQLSFFKRHMKTRKQRARNTRKTQEKRRKNAGKTGLIQEKKNPFMMINRQVEVIYDEIYLTTELDMMINTIANKMKTLKSFLQIAWSDGIIDFNPFKKNRRGDNSRFYDMN